jgi:ATP-dependent helicase HrpB
VRLYPVEDLARRPAHDTPEIARADLAPAALLLHAMGVGGLGALEWLDAPPAAGVERAEELLRQLGAFSPLGKEMARYPLHPRLARLIVEARGRGVASDGCTIAALLSAGERLPAESGPMGRPATRSDLLVLMESEWAPSTARMVRQIVRIVNPPRQKHQDEDSLLISVLAAFPDRVARRREASELQLAAGGPALLAPSSTVTADEFLVAVEAEDRRDQKAPLVRIASGIEPEWLLDLFPERVRETAVVEWNRAAERVESVSALMFDRIVLESHRAGPGGHADPQAAHALLTQKAMEAGVARFADPEEMAAFLARVDFASQHGPVPPLGPDGVERALRSLAFGLISFAELEAAARGGGLLGALKRLLPPAARRLLDEIAPERIRLSRGRHVPVHYEAGQPPWIASRLQDFFGMRETPAVARGAVRVVVRLLAPNHRPVQTTSDLAGFWQRLYPQVRKELARRYPKHAWPQDPLA